MAIELSLELLVCYFPNVGEKCNASCWSSLHQCVLRAAVTLCRAGSSAHTYDDGISTEALLSGRSFAMLGNQKD